MRKLLPSLWATALALFPSSCLRTEPTEPNRFDIPMAGSVELPGRFVTRTSAPEIMHATELLLAFGRKRTNIGGYRIVSEALALGAKSQFADWNQFRYEAAHYLQDADWRGPAREDLDWDTHVTGDITFHTAKLKPYPTKIIVAADASTLPVWAVAFVDTTRSDMDPVQALTDALNSYEGGQR